MRGIAYQTFGGPEVLQLQQDLPQPPVGPDTVLIRTHAAGVNPVDWKVRYGYLQQAFPHHFPIVPGWDVAGTVEAVGPAVEGLRAGDPVLAYVRRDDVQHGTAAELVPAPVRTVTRIPEGLGMEQAAALPLAGLTAYQGVVDKLGVSQGQRLLVHGAAGGVGGFAVQLGKHLGAEVIGTGSPGSADELRELGVDEVLDYTAGPISEQLSARADAVFDLYGGDALADAPAQLRPGGRVASVAEAGVAEHDGGYYVFVRPDSGQLAELAELAARGTLRVRIAARYPLAETSQAHHASETESTHGKIILTVD